MSPWLLLLALAVAPPGAETAVESFVWQAPPKGCPDSAQVQERLAALARSPNSTVRARALVVSNEGGFELTLTMRSGDASSERTLMASTCETLLDAALFSYSLALDQVAEAQAEADMTQEPVLPSDLTQEPTDDGSADLDELAEAEAPRMEPFADDPPPDESRRDVGARRDGRRRPGRVGFAIRGHGGLGQGPLGSISSPVGGSLIIGGLNWRAELGGMAYIPTSVSLDSSPSSGAHLSAWSLRGRGCRVVGRSERWLLPICGQLEGGLTRAAGFGVNGALSPQAGHLIGSGVVALGWKAQKRVRFWLDLAGGVSLVQASFSVDGASEELFRAPRATVSAELGVEIMFGPL